MDSLEELVVFLKTFFYGIPSRICIVWIVDSYIDFLAFPIYFISIIIQK